MKKTALSVLACFMLISCNTPTQKKEDTPKTVTLVDTNKTSLWTLDQRKSFINKNAKCCIDTMLIQKLIDRYEFEKSDSVLQVYIQSPEYGKFIKPIVKNIVIDIDAIAGKKPKEVEQFVGKPTKKEVVKPSSVGQCPKSIYLGGLIEVVYINDMADWITVNSAPSKAIIKDAAVYLSVQQFSDYTYVKVKTD